MSSASGNGERTTPMGGSCDQLAATRFGLIDWLIVGALAGLILAMYVRTLAAGLLYGDSGEFQTLGALLSMSHPTGYPVYLLIGHILTRLPFESPAVAMNLLSALAAALSVVLVHVNGRLLTGRRWLPLVGALALAISTSFWSQAIIAEVYTLGAAWILTILACLLWWRERRRPLWLAVAGCLGGLSLGVHLTVGLLAPAVILFMVVSRARRNDWSYALSGAAIGLLLYVGAFALVDANQTGANYFNAVIKPSADIWGLDQDDFDDLTERLQLQISAPQYQGNMFSLPIGSVRQRAADYVELAIAQLSLPVVGLALLGLATLLGKRWRVGMLLIFGLAAQFVLVINYDINDIALFHIPSYALLAIAATAGLDQTTQLARRLLSSRFGVAEISLVLVILPLVMLPSARLWLESIASGRAVFVEGDYPYPVADPDQPYQSAAAIVDALAGKSVLLTGWKMLYPLYYVAYVERDRTDLLFHEMFPQFGYAKIPDSMIVYIETQLDAGYRVFASRRIPLRSKRLDQRPVRFGALRLIEIVPR